MEKFFDPKLMRMLLHSNTKLVASGCPIHNDKVMVYLEATAAEGTLEHLRAVTYFVSEECIDCLCENCLLNPPRKNVAIKRLERCL